MIRRTRNGNLRHARRDVSTRRPMHITHHLRQGLPSLRRGDVRAHLRDLVGAVAERGVRVVAYAIMADHVHLIVLPASREALADAARYLFAQLARRLNALWKRRGRVFSDRYASQVGRSVRQAFHMLAYVLRNPVSAGLVPAAGSFDPFTGADEDFIGREPFLRSVFGRAGPTLRALLRRMAREPVRFTPLHDRLQPRLVGL